VSIKVVVKIHFALVAIDKTHFMTIMVDSIAANSSAIDTSDY
jgi:hypothetical protein